MPKFTNRHRRLASIKIGDEVYLKIRPHKQQSMPTRLHPKLSARYCGPVAYKLQLLEEAHIHPIFHVSQLKKVIGNERIETTIPPEFQGLEEGRIPKEVLKTRVIDRQGETVKQVLIQ